MKCPYCQNKIEVPDLWEFFDCTYCGSALQLENNELKILKEPGEKTSTQQNLEEDLSSSTEELVHKTSEDFSEPSIDPSPNTPSPDETSLDEPPYTFNEETPPSKEDSSNNNEDKPLNPFPADVDPSSEKSDLSNILGFESHSNQKNHFIYCLQISEISSKVLFDKIRYILKSPRVNLDCPHQAKNNTLVINNLNAVQMVYLVRKLSPLPVQIHWQQKSTLTT